MILPDMSVLRQRQERWIIYTRFLGASEIPSLLEYFRVTTEAVKFSIGDIKFYNVEFDPGSG